MLLVEALSESLGHFGYDSEGKVVWALLTTATASGHHDGGGNSPC